MPVHTLHLIINDIGVNYMFGGSDMEIESGSEKEETKKYISDDNDTGKYDKK